MPDKSMQKITMNLYLGDYDYMRQHYGVGWTGIIREMVQRHVVEKKYQAMRNEPDGK